MVDKKKMIDPLLLQQEEDEGEGSSGQQGGQVEFHDFLATTHTSRDAAISPEEQRRLLFINKDLHENHVLKQKALFEERQKLKEGKINYQQYQQGLGQGGGGELSPFKPNPALEGVQFAGIDKQENPLANEIDADTNPGNRDKLENQFRLTNKPQLQARPVFNPKPQR